MEKNEAAAQYSSFLGTGWSFPPEFVRGGGGGEVVMTSDEADIEESLRILLGTGLGERFMSPEYGLNMNDLLFEPMSTTMKTLIKDRIKTSILIFEPRINLLNIDLDDSAQYEGAVLILLEYEVRATNSRYNLVFPFYTSDSNEVRKGLEATNG
jgi:phage baseplate assembly protein W